MSAFAPVTASTIMIFPENAKHLPEDPKPATPLSNNAVHTECSWTSTTNGEPAEPRSSRRGSALSRVSGQRNGERPRNIALHGASCFLELSANSSLMSVLNGTPGVLVFLACSSSQASLLQENTYLWLNLIHNRPVDCILQHRVRLAISTADEPHLFRIVLGLSRLRCLARLATCHNTTM